MMHALANIAFEIALLISLVAVGVTVWVGLPKIRRALSRRG